MWCKTCNIEANEMICPICSGKMKHLSAGIHPVFPEKRLLIGIPLNKNSHSLTDKSVRASSTPKEMNINRFFRVVFICAVVLLIRAFPAACQSNNVYENPDPLMNSSEIRISEMVSDSYGSMSGQCLIKGNINGKGEKIYHCPNWRDYDKTGIDINAGERWFCTESEAQSAGWRAPLYYTPPCELFLYYVLPKQNTQILGVAPASGTAPTSGEMVYICPTGTKYHKGPGHCKSDASQISISEAISLGYGACGKCY